MLVALFIAVPLAELALLIEIGRHVGVVTTIALVIVTGALGAALARHQGLGVLRDMRGQLAAGQVPASSLVDGLIILVAAALLITPGILTDTVGFLCL
ncbi:MAG: FxsA family protein, partial [Candidatus Rokubacteria bacterium]|nr:FxsA family protein [Candidatus Rokubacteria bacterium]